MEVLVSQGKNIIRVCWAWGKRGEDSPCLARVPPMLWAGGHGRAARCFPLGPGWASGQPPIPGDPGDTLGPGDTGERAEGERFPHRQESLVWALMNRDSLWF